jgi:hypothetical protein
VKISRCATRSSAVPGGTIRSNPAAAWLTSSAYTLEPQHALRVRGEDGLLLVSG